MKEKGLFKKRNIALLYSYFCSGKKNDIKSFMLLKCDKNYDWFEDFKKKEDSIYEKIEKNLKKHWKIERIPIIEKTVLSISSYEIIYVSKEIKSGAKLINKAVEFSKKHSENDSFKYVNAILDSILKEKFRGDENNIKKF